MILIWFEDQPVEWAEKNLKSRMNTLKHTCPSVTPSFAYWYSLSDECVSRKLRVTEGHVCFLMCSFCFLSSLMLIQLVGLQIKSRSNRPSWSPFLLYDSQSTCVSLNQYQFELTLPPFWISSTTVQFHFQKPKYYLKSLSGSMNWGIMFNFLQLGSIIFRDFIEGLHQVVIYSQFD